MDGDPVKRPSMQLIYDLMKKLDSLINTTPVKPIVVENEPESQSQPIESTNAQTNNNNNLIINNTNDTGLVNFPRSRFFFLIDFFIFVCFVFRSEFRLTLEVPMKQSKKRSKIRPSCPISIEKTTNLTITTCQKIHVSRRSFFPDIIYFIR